MNDPNSDDERLLAYAAGELDGTAAALVEAELAASSEGAATIACYRAVQAILQSDDGVAPPASALARAKAIFPAAPADLVRRLDLAEIGKRLIAEVTFDSGGGLVPALAGFRGGGDGRQLMFQADGTVVDLQLEPPADNEPRWRIFGQVDASTAESNFVIGLAPVDDNRVAVAVTTDRHGGFTLWAAAGRYNIFVRIAEGLVVLPDLVVG